MNIAGAKPNIATYMILRDGNKIAFLLREHTRWMNGNYSLPSGRVEEGESFVQTAVREAKEELGIDVAETDVHHILTMQRLSTDDEHQHWVDLYFEIKKWEGEAYNAEPDVHGELKWFDPKQLPKNVVYNIPFAFEQIEKGNVYCEHGFTN